MAETKLTDKKKTTSYYVKSAIGLIVMIFFRFIPAPEPITEVGVAVFGIFLGLIFLISTVDYIWPSFAAICFYAFYALDVYPNSTQEAGIYEANVESYGNWITLFIITMMLVCAAMEQAGLMRRIALYFVSRKFASKGAWPFTIMLFLAGLIIASVMDPVPACLTMMMCTREIIRALGFKHGDTWPKMVITCMPILTGIGFAISPIGHNLPIAILTIVSEATGTPVNMVKYLIIGIPVGIVVFALMMLTLSFS